MTEPNLTVEITESASLVVQVEQALAEESVTTVELPSPAVAVEVTEVGLTVQIEEEETTTVELPAQLVEVEVTQVAEVPNLTVQVQEAVGEITTVELPATPVAVEIEVPGPAGPIGPQGIQGIQGLPGSGGDKHFDWIQNNPSTTWGPIEHNLQKYPNYGARNSAGNDLEVGVIHHDINTATLTLSAADSGVAYFN